MTRNTVDEKVSVEFESYHVGIAAEAFAAGLLAHAGYEVLVQYGANQPLYDLLAVKGKRVLKVAVKGTQIPGWALTGGAKKDRSYAEAADAWLGKHGADLVFMFVQFQGRHPRLDHFCLRGPCPRFRPPGESRQRRHRRQDPAAEAHMKDRVREGPDGHGAGRLGVLIGAD